MSLKSHAGYAVQDVRGQKPIRNITNRTYRPDAWRAQPRTRSEIKARSEFNRSELRSSTLQKRTIKILIKYPKFTGLKKRTKRYWNWINNRLVLPKKLLKKMSFILPYKRKHPKLARVGWGLAAGLVLFSVTLDVYNARYITSVYALDSRAEELLPQAQSQLGMSLRKDLRQGAYVYNEGYQPSSGYKIGESSSPRFSASFSLDPKEGSTIFEPYSGVKLTMKPEFSLGAPQQDRNRIIYPLRGMDGQKVETLQVANTKEDIILNKSPGKKASFTYLLELSGGTEARMMDDGSVGVYGADSSLLGDVSTGTKEDKELLKMARNKAEKNNLLFRIPAPFVKDSTKTTSKATARYILKDNRLTIEAINLDKATYPLSIDPTVYIETASRLMRGNNEGNIDFDIDNELIQKGKTTGGRFDDWGSTLSLPVSRWNHATAVAGGYIYVAGGNNGSGVTNTLYWAKFNPSTGQIEPANPSGDTVSSCGTTWCTSSAYNLPAVRQGSQLIAYNGYLYMLGGNNGTTSQNTVYIAKLGVNGEPQLWKINKNDTPVFWYTDSGLPSAVSYFGAVAFNNRLYIAGGTPNVMPSGTGSTALHRADILPSGKLTTWTAASGAQLLPATRHSFSMQVYNDRLYVIGGATGTTTQSTVYFNRVNSDGSLNNWQTGQSITTVNGTVQQPRASMGGSFGTIWGGFIYISGGCATLNTSGYCTSVAGDTHIASMNADGSITDWTAVKTVAGTDNQRVGYGLVAWRNILYGVGGCSVQNTTTGACSTTLASVSVGVINKDGEVSTVSDSSPIGTASSPCASGLTNPTDCDLPPQGDKAGQSGQMAGGVVINNGYIYYIGGCTSVGNNSVCFTGNAGKASDNVAYAAISSDGNIVRAASCAAGFTGNWCVVNDGIKDGSNSAMYVAAFSYAVFNNTLYIIGGTSGRTWQGKVLYTSFNSDGSLGTWGSQTFASLSLGNARGYTYAFTRANPAAAAANPGNLYILGGCSGILPGLDCTEELFTDVYKCDITTARTLANCTTTGQLQIDSEPGLSGNQGLGVMAGTVYANYVYLIGGQSNNEAERGTVLYAKIDNNNNIVAVDGQSDWEISPHTISPVRRRGLAFGYNGYIYALAGFNTLNGNGSLNDLLYSKINVSDGSISPFSVSSVTVQSRWDLRGVVNNGYVYAIGGCNTGAPPASCSAMSGIVQTFQLYNNYSGSPKSFAMPANQFTGNRLGASAAIVNGYIYLAGGCTSATDCTDATNSVISSKINADGTLGSWTASTPANLPADRAWGGLMAAGGTLYYVGGQGDSGGAVGTIYFATPAAGNITAWNTSIRSIDPRTKFGYATWNNRMYVVGGYDAAGNVTPTVLISTRQVTGGELPENFISSTALPVARAGATVVAYANNLYAYGGTTSSSVLNDAQYAKINTDGSVGNWTYTTSLPVTFMNGTGFAANGFMYIFAGRTTATECSPRMFVSPISANTTIISGNNPTGVGDWYETNIRYSGSRYGAASAYADGKMYLMGGACGASLTYPTASNVLAATVQAQPQIARYSRMIDTDKDVFPTVWLMNGLDNSIGARWYMRYRSMTDPLSQTDTGPIGVACSSSPMSTWGQDTDFGEVTLGKVESYVPKDGSGVNTNCARYFYLIVTIDSQQAYGYPEDVTRGPTIADLSLFYTASPSQRLLHGKTFTGGEQMPLDTPCGKSNNKELNGGINDPLYAACPGE